MARHRQVGTRGRSGGIHNKEWEAACIDSTTLDLVIGTTAVFTMFVADEAETLLRTRGHIQLVLNAAAIDESATLAVGIAIVSARAAAAGAASIPRPSSEGAYPWIWHGWLFGSTIGGINVGDAAQSMRLEVDSKAMRKLKETEVMILAFEVCESIDLGGVV